MRTTIVPTTTDILADLSSDGFQALYRTVGPGNAAERIAASRAAQKAARITEMQELVWHGAEATEVLRIAKQAIFRRTGGRTVGTPVEIVGAVENGVELAFNSGGNFCEADQALRAAGYCTCTRGALDEVTLLVQWSYF